MTGADETTLDPPSAGAEPSLFQRLAAIRDENALEDLAVSYYDYETTIQWGWRGDEWFHAASTMKIAILLGVFGKVHAKEISLEDPLHVRNRFKSIVEAKPFILPLEDSGDAEVAAAIGRSLSIDELCRHMIVTSSNLATNLLVELVGVDWIATCLDDFDIRGIRVLRGVQDEAAFEAGLNNEVTANGLTSLLRLIVERKAWSDELSERMLEILHGQKLRSGIPAGLPDDARVAHKTGNISTVHHDAGIVFVEGRRPYVLTILTRFAAEAKRSGSVAAVSREIHRWLGRLTDE